MYYTSSCVERPTQMMQQAFECSVFTFGLSTTLPVNASSYTDQVCLRIACAGLYSMQIALIETSIQSGTATCGPACRCIPPRSFTAVSDTNMISSYALTYPAHPSAEWYPKASRTDILTSRWTTAAIYPPLSDSI